MDTLSLLIQGVLTAASPLNLFYGFAGVLLGTLVGVLPGLGPAGAIALLLPLALHAPPLAYMIMLFGITYGAQYGGSTTSILVNIPGEASSVITCLDGYAMARQGRAGPALGIAAFGSFIGGHCRSRWFGLFSARAGGVRFTLRSAGVRGVDVLWLDRSCLPCSWPYG